MNKSKDIEMMTKELPINFGPLKNANANARLTGPCGDTIEFWLKINDIEIEAVTFITDGCKNSIICGSTAGYIIQGKTLNDAFDFTQEELLLEIGYLPDNFKHCALLAVDTIKKALEKYIIANCYQEGCSANNQCCNDCDGCSQDMID